MSKNIMATQSITYKIAAVVQHSAAVLGMVLMLAAVFSENTGRHDWAVIIGPVVGFLFFLVAMSSAVKSFGKK